MQYYAHDSLGRQARKTFDDRLARAIILVTSRYLFLSKKRDTCKACKVLHSPIVLLKTWLRFCRVHRRNRNFIQYRMRIISFTKLLRRNLARSHLKCFFFAYLGFFDMNSKSNNINSTDKQLFHDNETTRNTAYWY